MELTPANAPVVVMLFLITLLLLAGGCVAAAALAWRGRRRAALRIAEALGVIVLLYAGALLTHSWTSQDQLLEPGQLKYLCEVDCHLAYSVQGVRVENEIAGGLPRPSSARLLIVSLKTWFDPRSISSRRGNGPLRPNPRAIVMEDASGRTYRVAAAAEKRLEGDANPRRLLQRSLRPGESYVTELAFEAPPRPVETRLLISEDVPEAAFIISHENSLLHKKTWFRIPAPPEATAPSASSAPPSR